MEEQRAVSFEINKYGSIYLTTEVTTKFLWFKKKKIVEYIATNERLPGYWNWRLLPNRTLINDLLSYTLNDWYRDLQREKNHEEDNLQPKNP